MQRVSFLSSRYIRAPSQRSPLLIFRPVTQRSVIVRSFSQTKHKRSLSSFAEVISVNICDGTELKNLLEISEAEEAGDQLKESVEKLSSSELRALVRDLSIIHDQLRGSDEEVKLSITQLADQVRLESLRRLKSYNVTADKFISQSNDNLGDVLEFCSYWRLIDEPKRKKSVISQVINNIGDTERRTSVQRFKHFTKDTFVLFCNLMRHVHIYKDFHRYYVLVKFLDLFDQMTEEDISDVCQTLAHHGIHLPSDHPLALTIKTKLMDFMEENLHSIQSRSLSKICVAFSPSLEYQLPREIIPRILQFQKKIIEENIDGRFDVKVLLNICNLTNNSLITTRSGVNKDFLDVLLGRIIQEPSSVQNLSSKDIASLTFSISKHRDTPRARLAMLSLLARLRVLLTESPAHTYKNAIFSALQLAHTGLYDKQFLAQLFSSDFVCRQTEGGGSKVSPQLKYLSPLNTKGGFYKSAGDLVHLQGMMELECPDYTGPRITEDLEDNLELMTGLTPLQLRKSQTERERSFLEGKQN